MHQYRRKLHDVQENPLQFEGLGAILKKLLEFAIIILGSAGFLGHGLKEIADLIKFMVSNALPDYL